MNLLLAAVASLVVLELVAGEESETPAPRVKYGYQDGDVTQGVGYGHHLHPFYYRGKLMKYYDCAIEDEWRPFSMDQHQQQKKPLKSSPPKKYAASPPKKRFPPKKKTSRNDRTMFTDPSRLEQDHAKFIREINGMTEKRPSFARYRILVPDAEEELMESDHHHHVHRPGPYRVYEHSSDAVADAMKSKVTGQAPLLPFQRYKKFRVITVKPPNVKVQRVVATVPTLVSKPADPQADSRGRLTPQTFAGKAGDAKDKGAGTRKGRHFYPMRPQLTLLEQFLVLFPKFI